MLLMMLLHVNSNHSRLQNRKKNSPNPPYHPQGGRIGMYNKHLGTINKSKQSKHVKNEQGTHNHHMGGACAMRAPPNISVFGALKF